MYAIFKGHFCNKTHKMAIRKDNATKISHAELLYKEGRMGKEIAKIVGVTEVTITSWIKKYGWKEKRAATAVSRPQLVNKLLGVIDDLLEKVKDSDDPMVLAGLSDKLSKFAATVYLATRRKNFYITIIYALSMTFITSTYIFITKDGFALGQNISYVVAGAITIIVFAIFIFWYKRFFRAHCL